MYKRTCVLWNTDIRQQTMESRSEIVRLSLKHNTEKFQNRTYKFDSVDFFDNILQRPFERKLQNFFAFLSNTSYTMEYFMNALDFDLEFIILTLSFYECETLLEELLVFLALECTPRRLHQIHKDCQFNLYPFQKFNRILHRTVHDIDHPWEVRPCTLCRHREAKILITYYYI